MLRIGVTSEVLEDYQFKQEDPPDINRDLVSRTYLNSILDSLKRLGHSAQWIGDAHNILNQSSHLFHDFDYIFNLAEGLKSKNRSSAVPLILELLEIPYLGSDAFVQALTLNKFYVSQIAQNLGVRIPQSLLIVDPKEILHQDYISFPVIAKPVHEGSSIGIFETNIAQSIDDLLPIVNHLFASYDEPILVQEFIVGYELTVPIVGNKNLEFCEPMSLVLDGEDYLEDKIYSSDIKHFTNDRMNHVKCSLLSNKGILDLKQTCWKIFYSLGMKDYGRFDFRMDNDNRTFLIDVNAIADLSPESSFTRSFKVAGMDHDEMISFILQHSFLRWGINGSYSNDKK